VGDNSVREVEERRVIYGKGSGEYSEGGKSAYSSAEVRKSHYSKGPPYKSAYPDIITVPKGGDGPFLPLSEEDFRPQPPFYAPSKYSQPDPLYHPAGDVVKSSAELSLPARYDNSYSNDYKSGE
jgi:hypothetical protein